MSDQIPPPQYSAVVGDSATGSRSAEGKSGSKPEPGYGNSTGSSRQPINLLILGETANGKSTLIKQLGVYGGHGDIDIDIGYGE